MTSLLTNTSALAALQTLSSLNSGLQETQGRISSGLRVETASDNAAYWSIATTMRSDGKAVSAVSDALGMASAKVDVAYAGTDSIVDVLTEFKAKLVAATEDGVDKAKVQDELKQLNLQAESIVASSSFNGVNWLTTDAPTHLMVTDDLTASVMSSFVRSDDGSVKVETESVNLKLSSMLNTGGGGILQKELGGVGDIGGFRGTNINSDAHQGHENHNFAGPATFGSADYIDFDLVVDAGDYSAGETFTALRIDKSVIDAALGTNDGKIRNASDMRKVLNQVFSDNGVPATANETRFSGSLTAASFEIASLETSGHPGSSIDITGVASDFDGVYPSGFGLGLENAPLANHDNMYPEAHMTFGRSFTVSEEASITFDVQVGPSPMQTYTIDRATVDAALGTSDGYVGNATDLATIIAFASAGSNLVVVPSGDTITFSADRSIYPEAGNHAARVSVGNVQSDPPWTLEFDLDEVDVTGSAFGVDEYLTGVEYMLKRSIESASTLGSLQSRIEGQTLFASKLMDSLDSGIGRLVDADMEQESSRLAAQQTQQQLAIQALSIANSAPSGIISLFR
ncbi:flagellin [Rhizobium sp. Rhizsp42]|uniref:flagellin N-terminal helical domain-containing protein n=1 Tax=Rhizobium sp. Rhizsp42 TaxID=3243034 RepID=UPI0039AECBF7